MTQKGVADHSEYMGPENTHTGEVAEGGVVGGGGRGKVDGLNKIVGQALFVADMKLPRMVYAKVLRSTQAHARIVSIDASDALAMPGVLRVVTGEELPTRYGAIPVAQDETALALDRVRYIGEPVAAVCAISEDLAWEAVRKIRVKYEPIDPILTIDQALNKELPPIHDWRRKKSNVLRRVFQSFGDVDQGLDEADLVLEQTYEYPGSTHVPLEPQATLARPEPDGRLTIWSSTQNPHYMHRTLARVLNIPQDQIRLIKPDVGAGYGGKCDTFVCDVLAAYLARELGRPVRFIFEREEVFYAHRGRHRTRMWLKMGMNKDGTIKAIDFKAWADGGAYSSYGVVTSYYLGVFGTIPYQLDHYRFTAWRCYTNKPPCGPKRGHGAIQPRFALEMHIDQMASQLGLDPAEVRRKNCVAPHSETINGLRVTSMGLPECLDRVIEASGYHEKRGNMPPGKGIGLAVSAYMCGALHPVYQTQTPHSGVQLKIDRSGRVTIFSGTADVGQGSNHMLAVLVSERLGLQPEDCTVIEADSDLTPVDLGSYSSRVTFMAGNAAVHAADRIRKTILEAVALKLDCPESELIARDRRIGLLDESGHMDEERSLKWRAAVELAESRSGTLGATGSYRPPKIGSRFKRQSVGPSPAYSFTAQVAEVSVDTESFVVTIDKIWCAHDLGRVLHREIAEGQVEGCVYMGAGEALLEDTGYEGPVLRAPSILEYRIPTVLDTPEIEVMLVESHDPEGPFGAKETGEGPQLSTVPAVGNAIQDAIGVWMTHPPYTPYRVMRAVKKQQRSRGTK